MESFLVYLFNFYYAISELEQNKQNNTIIFFLLFIFLTKKWTSAVCGGVRAHPSHPPPYGPEVILGVYLSFFILINVYLAEIYSSFWKKKLVTNFTHRF